MYLIFLERRDQTQLLYNKIGKTYVLKALRKIEGALVVPDSSLSFLLNIIDFIF